MKSMRKWVLLYLCFHCLVEDSEDERKSKRESTCKLHEQAKLITCILLKRQTSWSEPVKLKKWCICKFASVTHVLSGEEYGDEIILTSATPLWVIHCLFYGLGKPKLHLKENTSIDRISNTYGIMIIWILMVFSPLLFFSAISTEFSKLKKFTLSITDAFWDWLVTISTRRISIQNFL